MRNLLILVGVLIVTVSCKKDEPLAVVFPKDYLPAYPGSIWYYSNGDVSKVHTEYMAHSYQAGITSPGSTSPKLVPYIDHEYLYEYGITQNSMTYPLKTLLSETDKKPWVVDIVEEVEIYREMLAKLDSINVTFDLPIHITDTTIHEGEIHAYTTYKDILVVVEYLGTLDKTKWNKKEYYAKNIGLIQVEINNPYDTLVPIIQKKLVNYNINK
jgi:hypothetical protein